MLCQCHILSVLNVLETIVKLEKRMEDIEENVNYVGRDMKDAVRADIKDGVQDVKDDFRAVVQEMVEKYINEGRETEAISKRNGELYLIGFSFAFNVFMN